MVTKSPTLTDCPTCRATGKVESRLPFRQKTCGDCGGHARIKWAFARSVLEDLADQAGAELMTYPLEGTGVKGQFRAHVKYMLEAYAGLLPETLPKWAWDVFDRYDNETFSEEMLRDLSPAGCVIFRRR
jgi:hypothetical protein